MAMNKAPDPDLIAPSQPRDSVTLRELIFGLARNWRLVGSVWGSVLALVAAWTFLATPVYKSTAVIRILDQQTEMGMAQQLGDIPGADLLGLGRDELESEVGVLRSWRLTEAIVDSLALTVNLKKPAGIRREILEVQNVGDIDWEGKLTLKYQGAGSYSVRVKEPRQPARELDFVQLGETLEINGYRLQLSPGLLEDPPGKIRIDVLLRYQAVDELRDDLDIRRQEGGSRLIEISHTIPDREMAATIVNSLATEYTNYKTDTEHSEARFTVTELREEVQDYSNQLTEAEEALRIYQEENRIVAPEEQATQQVRRYAEILIQRDVLDVERSSLSQLLEVIGQRAGGEEPTEIDPRAYRQLATFPTLISNQAIQDLLMGLLELENERSALLVLRQDESRDVRQFTDRIKELEIQLFEVGINYLESLDGHLASIDGSLESVSRELEEFPEQEMEYLRLYRDRSVLGEALTLLEAQLRLAEVQDAIRDEGVRIIDTGVIAPEDEPEFPKPLVNMLLGFILAGALGVSAGLIREA
jgi:tyrosine-protein kinase Etk/Wzc